LTKGVEESRRQKIRVIQKVEELGPELHVESLRDSWNLRVLEHSAAEPQPKHFGKRSAVSGQLQL
jgi:hypothetical protein